MKMKLEYSITRHFDNYVVWVDVVDKKYKIPFNSVGVFSGTRKQCLEYIKEHKLKWKQRQS